MITKAQNLLDLLLEGSRIDTIVQRQGPKILDKLRKDRSRSLEAEMIIDSRDPRKVLEYMAKKGDPTAQGKFLQWITNQYIKSPNFMVEDFYKVKKPITAFSDKSLGKFKRSDIGQYKTWGELVDEYESKIGGPVTASNKAKTKEYRKSLIDSGQANVLASNSRLIMLKINTKEASCEFGKGSKWCTAASSNNMFDTYNKDSDIIIIRFRGKPPSGLKQFYQVSIDNNYEYMRTGPGDLVSQRGRMGGPYSDHMQTDLNIADDEDVYLSADEAKNFIYQVQELFDYLERTYDTSTYS